MKEKTDHRNTSQEKREHRKYRKRERERAQKKHHIGKGRTQKNMGNTEHRKIINGNERTQNKICMRPEKKKEHNKQIYRKR